MLKDKFCIFDLEREIFILFFVLWFYNNVMIKELVYKEFGRLF